MGLLREIRGEKWHLARHFAAFIPSFGTKHMLSAAKSRAFCMKKLSYLRHLAMLFAWKSRAKCTKMLGDEWERGCFRQTKGRRMRWNGWEKSQKHSPENAPLQQSSEAKWCKMHHLMITFYLKDIWKTRKNLRFDGLRALKNARMACDGERVL